MRVPFRRAGQALAVLLGLALGGLLLVLFVADRQAPERLEMEVEPAAVSVIEARPLEFRLEARGHGVARPTETWQAVANVSGRVVERHPDLESGAFLREGTLLVALDPTRYELALAEIEGEIASLAAESLQLDAEEENFRRLLEVERETLALSERELARIESLAERGTVAPARLDEQRRAALAQRQSVVSLQNSLDLLPSRRAVLEAQRKRTGNRLAQAQRDLEDTRFVAPYDLRLGEVEVELHQFVGVGQRLFRADSLAAAEVEARVPFTMLRRLLGVVAPEQPPEDALGLGERVDFSAIEAELELVGAADVRWAGQVVRVASGLDPATRMVRVVVRVEHPYRGARPPDRPPLQRDMYTRVRLSAESPTALMAVPASAVHQGELYLVDEADRLERRQVEVAFEQGGLAVIVTGLAAGERVVVDDLPSALRGMALTPRRDEVLERRIAAQAAGLRP